MKATLKAVHPHFIDEQMYVVHMKWRSDVTFEDWVKAVDYFESVNILIVLISV